MRPRPQGLDVFRPGRGLRLLAQLQLAIGFSLAAQLSVWNADVQGAEKLNVLFLFADDQRADTIAAHGNPAIRTPHLDRLAQRGLSFRNNYCFGSNSGAVCIPSRAMLMTGKMWLHTNNAMNGELILPERLQQHGYTTFISGKWHNQPPALLRGFARGRAIYLGGMSDHTEVYLDDIVEPGKLGNKRIGEKFSSELFADAVIDFLRSYESEQPFFAYVAFTAPHDPRQPPEADRQWYYQRRPPLPANFLPQHPFDNGHTVGGRDENLGAWPRTREMISDQLAEYYGLITHLDRQVGRVLDALAATPHAHNTLIIYAADHGLAIGSHGLLGKQSVYEHSMKCPLMIVGPGVPQGEQTAFTYLFDLYPTLCDLLGIEPPAGLDGHSLRPLWSGEKATVRDSVFLPFRDQQRAVRNDRWKYICYPQINHEQLFDLQQDPHETQNLAESNAHQDARNQMRELLRQWQQKTGDPQPLSTPNPKPKWVELSGRKRLPDRWQPEWIRDKYFEGEQPSAKDRQAIEQKRREYGG